MTAHSKKPQSEGNPLGPVFEPLKGTELMDSLPKTPPQPQDPREGADARKYANYTVEIRESARQWSVAPAENAAGLMKFLVGIYRIPSEKIFAAYVRRGLTPHERALAERWALKMPDGEWAVFPDLWVRTKDSRGVVVFRQYRGVGVDVDFMELELQMMLDLGSEVR